MNKTGQMIEFEEETGEYAIVTVKVGFAELQFPSEVYVEWLEAELLKASVKATAYDRLMSGGKKTPKDVANFLDLPIAQDKEGFWHAFGSPPAIDELRGTWGSLLGYEKEIPSCNIRYAGDWKDSITMPDEWEDR